MGNGRLCQLCSGNKTERHLSMRIVARPLIMRAFVFDEKSLLHSKWPSGDFVLLDSDLYVRASICDCTTANYERNAALILTFRCTKTIQVSLLANALMCS